MNSLMIKALGFAVVLILATIFVVTKLNIDIFADSVNALTMGGAIAIAVITAAVSVKYINQMKTDTASGQLADENWDGIGEYKNELPSGWAYSFLGTIIWALWYWTVGYPVNAYSQIGEYNEEVKAYNAKFEAAHKTDDAATLKEMGESIFLVQCQQCHGATGDGLSGRAQDFTSHRSKEEVLAIINNGQNALGAFPGGMPAGMASGADAEAIAAYVAGGFKGEKPAAFATCASCHGENGKGMPMVAPSINGYAVHNALAKGKKGKIGRMPAFGTMITPVQEKALTAYVQSLAN
ncbi:Cytochrome c oxidase subunit CcoP [hydrothermal vent metagenome]|uniref:Cytochrome c oxidase subunit CcoP n=1 Tax=hydrothermal vent metagenome TaxID=652676 RepID=A0A1W1BLW3_9ZZZZ